MITIKDLSVAQRLLPVSLQINAGEKLHIIGPNGSGKSTLLSALAGLLPYQGQIELAGSDLKHYDLSALATLRAFLSQSERPAFTMPVFHYLSLAIPATARTEDVERVVEIITTQLSIQNKLSKSIHHLSGGEWQRVRLAAICLQAWPELNPHAQVMLLDEPAAPLDVGQQTILYQMIDMMSEQGLAVVVVNHDLNRTLRHSDKVVLLKGGVVKGYGVTQQVLTETLISQVFDSEIKRIDHQGQPYLIFE